MFGNQVARFTDSELVSILQRKGRPTLLGSTKTRLTMRDYMETMGIRDYIDIDLYGTPSLKLDLSEPVPPEYRQKYHTVADLGTLEHIINPWQALVNATEMLVDGGRVFHLTPCKIALNHGYYTISPQLFFDFYLSRGFRVLACELVSYFGNYDSTWYLMKLRSDYLKPFNRLDRPGVGFPYPIRVLRRLRRLISDYSTGTLVAFIAEKGPSSHASGPVVQDKYSI